MVGARADGIRLHPVRRDRCPSRCTAPLTSVLYPRGVTTPSSPDTGAPRSRPAPRAVTSRGSWVRRLGRVGIALVVALAAVVAAGLPMFVFPPQGDPTDASLVYVIGPPDPGRLSLAKAIRDTDGQAPLLVSVSDSRSGHGDDRFDRSALRECGRRGVTCKTPVPFTTAGEARLLTDYTATHAAEKTVVITFTPHVARTRYIFAKCYAGDVTVVGVDTRMTLIDWAYQYAYQSAAFVKAWFTPCP